MVKEEQAKELVLSLLQRGETIDPRDLTLFYAWMYSSYLALEPFPSAHRKYCERCLDSFEGPSKRLKAALLIMKAALRRAERGPFKIKEDSISTDYAKLLTRFSQHHQNPAD